MTRALVLLRVSLLLILVLRYAAADTSTSDTLSIINRTGWQIFTGQGYRYGPSIIANADGSIDMWFAASCFDGSHWDQIRYRHSPDGGHTWEAPDDVVVITPTDNSPDQKSCCDPGAIRFGGWYYVGYTSVDNKEGQRNHVFLARAKSPRGPYEKWNGKGWGVTPQPFLRYTGPADQWGCGEPSFVMKDGRLYVFYTWNDGKLFTDLAICDNPSADDWPAHMKLMGHVVKHEAPTEDSLDMKYVDALNRFVAVATHNRIFDVNADVSVWQSPDGIKWTRAPFRGDRVQTGAHNIGISGNELGHIDGKVPEFLSYAYGWPGKDFTGAPFGWANWATFIDPIKLSTMPSGRPVTVATSSTLNWDSSAPCAIDDDTSTSWSSQKHDQANADEWMNVWLGQPFKVGGLKITPCRDGKGFPSDFTLQCSDDGTSWTTLQSFTDFPATGAEPRTFIFNNPVSAAWFRLYATKLSPDETGAFALRIAEFGIQPAE